MLVLFFFGKQESLIRALTPLVLDILKEEKEDVNVVSLKKNEESNLKDLKL